MIKKKSSKRKLLLVDDMKEVHDKIIPDFLKAYDIDSAFTLQDALRKLKENKYDLVISDYNLSGNGNGEGIGVIRVAKERGYRALLMSTENHRQEARDAGATGFMFKKDVYKHAPKRY